MLESRFIKLTSLLHKEEEFHPQDAKNLSYLILH